MELTAVRTLDISGGLKLPLRLRQKLDWNYGNTIELFVKGNEIVLRLSKEEIKLCDCFLNKDVKDCKDCDFCENGARRGKDYDIFTGIDDMPLL